jgi:hypothetical protein
MLKDGKQRTHTKGNADGKNYVRSQERSILGRFIFWGRVCSARRARESRDRLDKNSHRTNLLIFWGGEYGDRGGLEKY